MVLKQKQDKEVATFLFTQINNNSLLITINLFVQKWYKYVCANGWSFQQLALAVSAAQQAVVNQAKQDALNHAAMLQRFQRPAGPPMMAMPGGPVTSMPLVMRPAMIPGPPTFVGANLMRPPPLGMPPGT